MSLLAGDNTLEHFDDGKRLYGVRGETPDNNRTTLQLDVHSANSGPLNTKLSKERAFEVELPKCVGYQDGVKPFKGPGGIEVLKKLHNVGEDPGHFEGAEEREGWTECVRRLTTCRRAEFEVIQGAVTTYHGFDLQHLGVVERVSADGGWSQTEKFQWRGVFQARPTLR